jgi:MinD-like ATPase involved in chromosome partitioning or flagellar assembly
MTNKTEIVAIASGKGGTGKTLIASCLGYALISGGQRVLMIDADPATDGLSLFLLGRKGLGQISSFEPNNTFAGILGEFQHTGSLNFKPRTIHRSGPEDHGVSYEVIISGRGLYGDEESSMAKLAVPDLDRPVFRASLRNLFQVLHDSGEYDYVLVDTRGGFAFESTDVCALADSFIVVTEPDPTSFYQDRNLVRRISLAAKEVDSPSVLRAFIVNKAVDGTQQQGKLDLSTIEYSFRLELTKEFPVRYEDTHPVPVDINALLAYKTQKIPYTAEPASLFSFSTLYAFSDILQIVTSRWSIEQVERWNRLVNLVSNAVSERNQRVQELEMESLRKEKELDRFRAEAEGVKERLESLKEENLALRRERTRIGTALERELERPKFTDSSAESGRNADGTRGFRRRSLLTIAIATTILLAVVTIVTLFVFEQWRLSRFKDLIVEAYNQNLPSYLRYVSIQDLANKYRYTKFDGINLDKGDLSRSRFSNLSFRNSSFVSADFSGAQLYGVDLSFANLTDANLGQASLVKANLQHTDLTGANLAKTDLRGANLTDSIVTPEQVHLAIVDNATILATPYLTTADSTTPGLAPASPMVSIQFNASGNPGLKETMQALRLLLQQNKLPGPEIEEIDNEYFNTVRYFNKEDEAIAQHVKILVENFMHADSKGRYKNFSLSKQYVFGIKPTPPRGQIEVWSNPKNTTKVPDTPQEMK